jgi:recombination protein RecA
MPSAHLLRQQIEAALANRIPSALTPAPRVVRPTAPTGIPALDDALGGGLPIGAITELAGPECSGRTSLALSFIAGLTQAARVCAWVDVSDALHPESAAAIGVDLHRLLWIRCGPQSQQLTLPGFIENPSDQSAKQLAAIARPAAKQPLAVSPETFAARCAEPVPKVRQHTREVLPSPLPVGHRAPAFLSSELCALSTVGSRSPVPGSRSPVARKPWTRLDQALRATDLLLQAGGFSAIVLDMASIAPEFALRIPLATWFRYRAAAERTHASVLLLTQHACTKSSAGLVLHCHPNQVDSEHNAEWESTTVFTGANHRIEITRERFVKVIDFDRRKPPQSDHSILWQSRTPWSATCPPASEKAARK